MLKASVTTDLTHFGETKLLMDVMDVFMLHSFSPFRLRRSFDLSIDRLCEVLDAWCGKAKSFWESGLLVQDPAGGHHEKQLELCHSLSKITDSAVAALVHPVRFISSIAPALLEHVVNLRHVSSADRGSIVSRAAMRCHGVVHHGWRSANQRTALFPT